jgi:NADH dehydrogenase
MILVAGSTGVLGMEICRRLRASGKDVRALVRATSAPDKVAQLRQLGCEIATGDLKDRASLDAACRNATAVLTTVTAITTAKPGDSFEATDGGGNMALIDAAKAAHVKQFVFVSFDGSGMPDSPLVQAKADAEKHLERSGVPHTILQPSLFMESWLGPMLFGDPAEGTARVYGDGTSSFNYVTVGDVAEVAVQCLDNPAARNATIRFGGPESVSQREAVQAFEEAFGKPFTVTELPESALAEQHRAAPDPFNKTFAGLMLAVARGGLGGGKLEDKHFRLRFTSVREYAKTLAASARR